MLERILRYKSVAFLFVAGVCMFAGFAPSAYADPHAVFYTDRAQEQLFYNVLAALNQADYVESGIEGSPYSRAQLLANREKQGFAPETLTTKNLLVASTHTDLPSVVSRNITLEGNDLWTAYLVNQFALEVKTRRETSELIRDLCTVGLGFTECSTNPGLANQQREAFVTTVNQLNQPNLSLTSALSTGTQGEKDLQKKLTQTKPAASVDLDAPVSALYPANVDVAQAIKFPRAASAEIGLLRDINQADQDALNTINDVTRSVASSFYGSGIDPNTFSNIEFSDENGQIKGEIKPNTSFNDQITTIIGLASLTTGAIQAAQQGLEQGLAFQQLQQQTPSLAKYTLTKNGDEVAATINTPSSLISDQLAAATDLYAQELLAQKAAVGVDIANIGSTSTVLSKQQQAISTPNPNQPTYAQNNIYGSPVPTPGAVAGTNTFADEINNLENTYYSTPAGTQEGIAPSTRLAPSFDEEGHIQFREASGQQIFKDPNNPTQTQCGFCMALDPILKHTHNVIASLYTDLYCFFFPTIAYCAPAPTPTP